jgi:hypothetical protein
MDRDMESSGALAPHPSTFSAMQEVDGCEKTAAIARDGHFFALEGEQT